MAQREDDPGPAPSPQTSSPLTVALRLAGAAVGAHLYATFVLTNTIADASARGLYDAQTCQVLLAEQRALLRAVRAAGRELAGRSSLAAAERQFLAEADAALDRLVELIDKVETLGSDPGDAHSREEFGALRVDALERVRRLLAPRSA
jgi:hypothetical protein